MTTLFVSIKNCLIKFNDLNLESTPIEENINIVNQSFKNNIIIILTSSKKYKFKKFIEEELNNYNIKYNQLIMEIPEGTKFIINSNKKSKNNLNCSYAISLDNNYKIDDLDKIILNKFILNKSEY